MKSGVKLMAGTNQLPNKFFIDYLGSYGNDNNLQYDEYVAQNAQNCGIKKPFNFVLNTQENYRDDIKRVIEHHHSTLILLSGRAGDGKTHFLRHIFNELIANNAQESQPNELWNKQPNFFSLTKEGIEFYFVKDFSGEIDQNKLGSVIEDILQQNKQDFESSAEQGPTEINSSNTHNLSATLSIGEQNQLEQSEQKRSHLLSKQEQETRSHNPCKIVIIAGNNGKILERFQYFFANETKLIGASFLSALVSYMLNHDRDPIDSIWGVQCHDMSACLGATEIISIFTEVLGDAHWDACKDCKNYQYCPIVRNRAVISQPLVLARLLQIHELLVDNNVNFTIRNIMLLLSNALLGRVIDNTQLNCANINKKYKQSTKDVPPLTCAPKQLQQFYANLINTPLGSNPYDNLLGINLSGNQLPNVKKRGRKSKTELNLSTDRTTPIFQDLSSLGIGYVSTKLIDEFLALGSAADIFSKPINDYYGQLKQHYDFYNLFNGLSKLHKDFQDIEQDANPSKEEQSSAAALHLEMQEYLMSLRRMMFFVLPADKSDELFLPEVKAAYSKENLPLDTTPYSGYTSAAKQNSGSLPSSSVPLFNPFLLTTYPFGLEYLKLKRNALAQKEETFKLALQEEELTQEDSRSAALKIKTDYQGINIRDTDSFDTARQLIVGLNRAFTNLMIMSGADKHVYITTNNKINTMALSVIYDRNQYLIKVDYAGTALDNAIRFEEHGTNRLALVFHSTIRGHLNQIIEEKKCFLDLSPKLFEYLMALAVGASGISFSQENSNDLEAFKASIDTAITKQKRNSSDPKIDDLIKNIRICHLSAEGSLLLN